MHRHFRTLALAALAALACSIPANAQSDILLRLRSGSPLGDRFRVDSASGFVAKGVIGIGIIPQSGAGDRLMWHPFKAAFRTGGVDGTQWDDANVGFYTLAAGYNTIAKGNYSTAAGSESQALLAYGVALGFTANSNGTGAVAIGYRVTADSDYGVAIGHRASTNGHDGAIVISDQSTTDSLEASANNQFSVRAAGGYRLYTNATTTTGVSLNAGGSSWNVISDRNRKEGFATVDGEDLLARLRSVPVSTWRYRDEADRTVRHIGPMAQDWARAFGFNGDDRTINMSDFDGVNLAAVQALSARTERLQAENAGLRARNQQLEVRQQQLDERQQQLEARLRRVEALLERGGAQQ
ncbi:MAG TPA: tail fiber domain-containing protein [Longimicrobium sp.]|nr:tail fiber domain-containing protein [Longimicrobium sp.]